MQWLGVAALLTLLAWVGQGQVMVDLEKEQTRPSNGEYSYRVENYKGQAWLTRN